jgi:hypothetical protein
LARRNNIISEVFDKLGKEELVNEEVDNLIINSLCAEIMDEVMDLGNDYLKDCKITRRQQTSSSSKKVKKIWGKAKNKCSKLEAFSRIVMGSRTQRSISSLVI